MNPKQIILQVLEIIGYTDDKEKFANEFLSLCIQQSLVNLMEDLSDEKQVELTQRAGLIAPEKMENLILEFFSKEKFNNAVSEASSSIFEDYLKTIIPTLNDEQSKKLEQFLST